MKHVTIFTDGSCKGNPGPGGWAAILRVCATHRQYVDAKGQRHEKALSGGIAQTTLSVGQTGNNRAEAIAVIQVLSALKESCHVDLFTDSEYLVKVATGCKARANLDLVTELRTLMAQHEVTVHHVEGHNGHPENERANRLAQEAATLQAQACPERSRRANRAVARRG